MLAYISWMYNANVCAAEFGRLEATVKIKPKLLVKISVSGETRSPTRTEATARDLTTVMDEPEERGGTNRGLTPVETLVAALAGCTNVITHRIAAAHGIPIMALRIDAEAILDRRGAALQEEIDLPIPELELRIQCRTTATDEQVQVLRNDLKKYCPVAKILRQSGTLIRENWQITQHEPTKKR